MSCVVILACLAAAAVAAPQGNERQVELIKYEHNYSSRGNFNYAIEADNGISVSVSGSPGTAGQVNKRGFYTYILEDGTPYQVHFIADENGFRLESDLTNRLKSRSLIETPAGARRSPTPLLPSITNTLTADSQDVPKPVLEDNEPEPVLEVDVPEPVLKVDVPEPVLEVDVPEPVLEDNVPNPVVKVDVPEPVLEVDVPEPVLEDNVPKPVVKADVPEPVLEVDVPEPVLEVDVPELVLEVDVPEPVLEDEGILPSLL
ncbi:magnetosome-associated protein MamJ [Procambarus clarkii]|uniref:magnetosome-associated protein MamJ n=1 Tax=Procambarus clarkii TaxID=6728 RepID=UPI001E677687|nr:ras GTPase-activating protein-binding protein 1-like [Procambarus clarkii]